MVVSIDDPIDPCRGPAAEGADWGRHSEWIWQGQRIHWRMLGDSGQPPMVLVHGFGAGSGHWRRNAARLVLGGWCVYAIDLIGFGASGQPGPDRNRRLDNRLWARQLHAFLEQVVGRPAVLVGHSLGGLVSLTCSVYFPAWVRAVVAAPLPDPTLLTAGLPAGLRAPRRPPWRRRLRRGLVILLCRLLPLELLVPLLARSPLLELGIQAAYRQPVIGDGELHRIIARPARRPGAVRALRAMSIGMALRPHGATAGALLLRLRHPLLLLWGEDDRLVPVDVAGLCRRIRPGLPLRILEAAGHCPHDEAAAAFSDAVLHWLGGLDRDPTQGLGPPPTVGATQQPGDPPNP